MKIAKFGKKIVGIIALFVCITCLFGCNVSFNTNPTEEDSPEAAATSHVNSVLKGIVFDDTQRKAITSDLKFTESNANYPKATISWSSTNEDLIAPDGTVNRPLITDDNVIDDYGTKIAKVDVTVTVSEEYVDEDGKPQTVSDSKTFKFTVKAMSFDYFDTIANLKKFAAQKIYVEGGVTTTENGNKTVVFCGTYAIVTAIIPNQKFFISDGESGMLVFKNPESLAVGDLVRVQGNVYSYYGGLQFGSEVGFKKLEAGTVLKNPETDAPWAITPKINYVDTSIDTYTAEFNAIQDGKPSDAMGNIGGNTFILTGLLKRGDNTVTHDWYSLTSVNGVEVAIYSKAVIDDLAPLDGKWVKMHVLTYDRYSENKQYRVLYTSGIEETAAPELTDAQKIANAKNTLGKLTRDYSAGSKLTLPTEDSGCAISWVLSDETTLVSGKFALVEKETILTATATITVGTTTDTFVVTLTVKPIVNSTIAEAITYEKGTTVKLTGKVEGVSSNKKCWYIKDLTGTLLVFATLPTGVTLTDGDDVVLIGTTNNYNGTPQIGTIISLSVAEAEWDMSAPTEVTIEDILAYTMENAPYGQYLQVTGKLVSDDKFYKLVSSKDSKKSISLYYSILTDEKLLATVDKDTEVTLFVYFYGNSNKTFTGVMRVVFAGRSGEFFIGDEPVVKPVPREYKYVSEAKAVATSSGVDATVRGVITTIGTYNSKYNNFSFLIQDKTGGLFVYNAAVNNTSEIFKKFIPGTELELKGKMKVYNGLYELCNIDEAAVTVISEGKEVPAVTEITPTSNLLSLQGKQVTLKDAIVTKVSGTEYNKYTITVQKDAIEYTFYCQTAWGVSSEYYTSTISKIEVGQKVSLTGWMNWFRNGQITPFADNCIEIGVITDQEKADLMIAAIEMPERLTTNLDLATGVVWEVVSGTAIKIENGVAIVSRGDVDDTVVLKATATVNEAMATKEFTIIVPKKVVDSGDTVEYTYDFVGNFATYAAAWESGYTSHEILSTDLGTDLYACKFLVNPANRQPTGQTIDDRPVLRPYTGASVAEDKYGLVSTFVVDATITSVSFEFKQWTTKTYKTVVLQVSKDGTTWTDATTNNDFNDKGALIISATELSEITNVRVVLTPSSGKVQCGLTSCVLGIKKNK